MDTEIMYVITQMLWLAAKLTAPIMLAALVVGTVVGLVQTVLQVQEPTLTFVPKLAAIAAVLVLGGGWMLNELTGSFRELLLLVPDLLRASA
jgi:flagellar biosynthetic protein FliQ